MAIVYSVAVRNSRLQTVINAIDAGAGSGLIKLGTAGMAVTLATITLNKPCATISAGVLTFSGTPLNTLGAALGVAAAATITDSAGLVVASGFSVGTSGTDIIVNLLNVSPGSIVTFISGAITGN